MRKRPSTTPQSKRRVFTAEFKREMVRQFEDRRAQGVSQAQIARELDLCVPMLQTWAREVARQPDAEASEVFLGPGRQPSEQEALRRLGASPRVRSTLNAKFGLWRLSPN